jgi:ribonuclease HI
MNSFALFTDVSLNPALKLGVGCYLLVPDSFLEVSPQNIERAEVVQRLILRRFEAVSSSELEVRTALWAFEDCSDKLKTSSPLKLRLYTDSQCITGLLKRRAGLEANRFLSLKTNLLLKNAFHYRTFYEYHDELGFEVTKVKGHTPSCSRDTVHSIFSFIDREARKALKLWVNEFASKD